MRQLGREFQHGWACDDLGPTDAEVAGQFSLLPEGGVVNNAMCPGWWSRLRAADEAEQARCVAEATGDAARVEWLENHPVTDRMDWAGLGPAISHTSGGRTVQWEIDPVTGAAVVTIHRLVTNDYDDDRTVVVVSVTAPATGQAVVWVNPDWKAWAEDAPAGGYMRRREPSHVWACAQSAARALGAPVPLDGGWPLPALRKPLHEPGPVRRL